MEKTNQLEIKFTMSAEDYFKWRNGGVVRNKSHFLSSFKFNSLLSTVGKFTSFQHIKNDYVEIEVILYKEDLLRLLEFTLELMSHYE